MIVFLEKVRVRTVFSSFEPVITEPLELCYLKAVLNEINIESYIIDELFALNAPAEVVPDVVVLTGYNVAENEIINNAQVYKSKYPHVKIIAGGVHIQCNPNAFHTNGIDYVCHTQSLNTFRILIEKIINNNHSRTPGVDSIGNDSWAADGQNIADEEILYEKEQIMPDRSLYSIFSHKFRYLEKKRVALIKGSIGCPHGCSYCYCKLLNSGRYVKADYGKMVQEMKNIDADYFWIVDDVLFSGRKDALEFIEIIKRTGLRVKIIGYLRADFILKEKDLLPSLKNAGLAEIIVGFEAPSNDELKGYEKSTNALDYPEVISLLKENEIDLTALFMVQPDYQIEDFRNLYKFISDNKINVYTISILTPIKGTELYELFKDKLTTYDPGKFDFLHLVLKPRLPKWLFYLLFYGVHIRLLKSKRIWKYLLRQ